VADFPRPAAGQNGNLSRNAFRGPGYIDTSLSVSKKFKFNGKWTSEVRLDAFNVFNRVNLNDPVMDLSSAANFGKSTSQLAPRMLQMGFRLRF
jgi:hypothetical protein